MESLLSLDSHLHPQLFSVFRRRQLARIIHHIGSSQQPELDVPSRYWIINLLDHCPSSELLGETWEDSVRNAVQYLLNDSPYRTDFSDGERDFLKEILAEVETSTLENSLA